MRKKEYYVGSETNYLRRIMVADESQCEKACLVEPQCVAVSSTNIWVTYRCLLYESIDPWSLLPKDNSNFYQKICRDGKFF